MEKNSNNLIENKTNDESYTLENGKHECPSCFLILDEEQIVCTKCGYDTSKGDTFSKQNKNISREFFQKLLTIMLILVGCVSTCLGYFLSGNNFWYGLLGLACGVVFAFVVNFIVNCFKIAIDRNEEEQDKKDDVI